MTWLRDPAWQQGLAILAVVAGAVLIYAGARPTGEVRGMALVGVVLFGSGVALPLVSKVLRARREHQTKSEDV